ncbi:S-adenosyl-L-methionine-dependent methyltransferase [Aspergillus sclerotioniger CBS 115572]|uniref:S-adenosyl-L-methionine-dependent methyltransferase n=1 Tax=Aspergillus sclerotioniger CBS 115572 TaxID=1450535 RepID=A0A317WPZ9_9EURO|nr:S-adenosyl-L-methionine-dependent methyltransferase [Aspergillus sclerotioniger CBS 115572]PWY88574.1 S-adenosyl-L-methionine-dependent methyltransferase [Aspergillus sclerotioniger CBS 115572]
MASRLLSSRGFPARLSQLRAHASASQRSIATAPSTTDSVTQLLQKVQATTKVYLDFVKDQGLPEPSYQHGDGLHPAIELPRQVQEAKEEAIEATYELHHLLLGPMGLLFSSPGEQLLLLSLQYIYRYQIAPHVPLDGTITFDELSKATNLTTKDLTRFLRVAISRHVFHEPVKGSIGHTAASKLLLNNPMVEAWLQNIALEFWPAFTRTVEATEKWPGSEEPNETGYALAHGTRSHPFDEIRKDPRRHRQFITAMQFSHLHPAYHLSHLLNNYNFDRSTSGATTIVDIGGSNGEVSIEIAARYPNVHCIVQDLPDTIAGLTAKVPSALAARVTGMAHDFLTPQPVYGADVYLLRWILHDWSDKYAIQILRNLTPALKKGARVVVNDICIPEPGRLGPKAERDLRYMDIAMKAFNNARERDVRTWEGLFAEADARFRVLGISVPPGAQMAVIEAEWIGECSTEHL